MATRDSALRYDSISIGFHWLIAALVILNLIGGLYMGELPRTDPNKMLVVMLHKSTGLTILVLSVLRLVWRLMNPWQALPAEMSPALKAGARTIHVLFYVLLVGIPLTGWSMVSASPRSGPIAWYGLFEWPKLAFFANFADEERKALIGSLAETHELLAFLMIALIVLHIGAALYHHYIRRDNILRRMMPG